MASYLLKTVYMLPGARVQRLIKQFVCITAYEGNYLDKNFQSLNVMKKTHLFTFTGLCPTIRGKNSIFGFVKRHAKLFLYYKI